MLRVAGSIVIYWKFDRSLNYRHMIIIWKKTINDLIKKNPVFCPKKHYNNLEMWQIYTIIIRNLDHEVRGMFQNAALGSGGRIIHKTKPRLEVFVSLQPLNFFYLFYFFEFFDLRQLNNFQTSPVHTSYNLKIFD